MDGYKSNIKDLPSCRNSVVGEIEYPSRHHDALYDDVINTNPFKFSLANQKAQFTNSSNQSAPPNQLFFFVGEGLGAINLDTSLTAKVNTLESSTLH